MMRSAAFYFEVCAFALIAVSHSYELKTKTQNLQEKDDHNVIRRKRTFGSSAPPCNMTQGVYLEKWERIDYKRVKFLLADPRYPNLPSFATCVPTFEQPSNWGDFFGSRLRTYFVPLETGNHYFYTSSNGGSELFISTDDKPESKTLISGVDGGFPSHQYEYDRFTNQKSLPIYLVKDNYYYLEAIMKDDHQFDHLEVALETPDGTFYKVIPSKFLWTTNRLSASQNATHQAILLKVAAKAGAKAGSSFGAKWAMKSGAKAGAKAGAMAGMAAGASAGANAGEKSAINTFKKTLEDALNTLHGDHLHKFHIIIKHGSVVDVTGPGMGGAVGTGSTSGAGGATAAGASIGMGIVGGGGARGGAAGGGGGSAGGGSRMAGAGGVAGTAAGGVEVGGGAGGGGGGGGGGGAATGGGGGGVSGGMSTGSSAGAGAGTGAGAGASAGASAEVGGAGSVNGVGVTVGGSSAGVLVGAGGVTGGAAGAVGGDTGGSFGIDYSGEHQITYIPKQGEDPQTAARALVWRVGGASRLVSNALYTVHSWDIPYAQENSSLNYCWQAHNGDIKLAPFCQVFILRIPGLYMGAKERKDTMSFESVCLPGYFLKQKNYHMILQKRDGSDLFDKESTFTAISVMKFARNYLLKSTHKDWYICQDKKKSIHINPDLKLDFYNGDPDVLNRCTFLFHPIPQTDNKYKMCKNVVGPVKHPSISGQPLPHPPHLVLKTQPPALALPSCIPVCPAGTRSGASGQTASLGPSSPVIPTTLGTLGTHSKPSVISTKKACVAVNFINNFGSQFTLYSSLKHEGYLVTGSGFKLKLIIDRPGLHSHVTFYARDPLGKRKILLNGQLSTSEAAVAGCPEFVNVFVTPRQGVHPGNTNSTPQPGVPDSTMLPPSTSLSPPAPNSPAPSSHALSPPGVLPAQPPAPLLPPTPSPVSYHNHLLPPSSHNHPVPSTYAPAPPAAPASFGPASSSTISNKEQGTTTSEGDHQAVHYHYHYHGKKAPVTTAVCPSLCSGSEECHPTCPSQCCKRDFDEEVSGDEDITVA